VEADAFDVELADLARIVRCRDVEHRHACGPGTAGLPARDRFAHGLGVIGLLVGEGLDIGKQIERIDHQQQVVMCLQVDVPGVGRRRNIGDGAGAFRIAHVDDRKALRPGVSDIGMAAMHHQLQSVATAANIGMPDQLHVAREIRAWKVVAIRHGCHLYYLE
jgi:hypothetical protein